MTRVEKWVKEWTLPEKSGDMETADKLAELIRTVWTANAVQSDWMYSLEYRIGKFISVTRRPTVIESAYSPVDVSGKDVRVDKPDALDAAIRAVREDMAKCCA